MYISHNIYMCVYLIVHSVKVTHLPWAQAPPCLRTERKARDARSGRTDLCGVVVADGSGSFRSAYALMGVAAA